MNSQLYGKKYRIPHQVKEYITKKLYTSSDKEGVKRAKNLVKNGYCTYQSLKRLKNFFDNYNGQSKDQFELAGGELMRKFVEHTLRNERSATEKRTEIKNEFIPNVTDDSNKVHAGKYRMREGEEKDLKKNGLAIIFNDEMKVLLLKRSPEEEYWMPNKWALVGGGIEEGETPIDATQREIKEETQLDIEKFKEKFVIQRSPDSVEHIFIAKYEGDSDDVILNEEHVDYGWYSIDEIKELDCVPNLIDYINIALKKYD